MTSSLHTGIHDNTVYHILLLLFFCSTVNATTLLVGQERAMAGEDYVFSTGMVPMAENVTTASVRITILPVSY